MATLDKLVETLHAYEKYVKTQKLIGTPYKLYDDYIAQEDLLFWKEFNYLNFEAEYLEAKLLPTPEKIVQKDNVVKYKVLNAPTTPTSEALFKERVVDPS